MNVRIITLITDGTVVGNHVSSTNDSDFRGELRIIILPTPEEERQGKQIVRIDYRSKSQVTSINLVSNNPLSDND